VKTNERRQLKTVMVALLGEIRKTLLTTWTYKVGWLSGTATLGLVFVSIAFLLGDGQLTPEELAPTLLGYLIWTYAGSAVGDLSYSLSGEISAGTLEQTAMSPVPVGLILLGRVLARFVLSTVEVLLLGGAMSLLLRIRLPMRWQGIPVLIITLSGVFGFGFMVIAAMLVFKQTASLTSLVSNALAFLNGTFLPVDRMPGWMAAIARTLPSTQGIVVIRRVVLDGQSLAAVWQDRSLVWLIVHSAIYLAIGWGVFAYCERIAKQQGSLGQY
jgi:ABC-2 type transport system permease protein